jgi:hypothetical protein
LLLFFAKPFRPDAQEKDSARGVEPPVSRELSGWRRIRWLILAVITAAIHGSIYWGPIPIETLRSSATGGEQYFVLFLPTIWSIFIFVCYPLQLEREVTWCSFIATFFWYASVGGVRT